MENNPTPVKEEKVTEEVQVEPAKTRSRKRGGKKVVKLVLMLLLLVAVLFVSNPSLLSLLPENLSAPLSDAMSKLFGEAEQISSVIKLDWIVVFQLVVMILLLQIIRTICVAVMGAIKPKAGRSKTILNLAQSGFNYLTIIVGIFWGMSILGVDLATLFASLGILALVIGFGAESLIADMITGLFMIFENEYNVGDIIELGGYRGTVTSIGIRTTCVTDAGGNVKVINNSDMRNIINLSSQSSFAICDFPIPYEIKIADAEKALDKVLTRVQEKYPEIFPTKPEYKGVQALDASAVTLRVVAAVAESDRFSAARLLNRELKEGMEELGISCPYNQIVVHKAD